MSRNSRGVAMAIDRPDWQTFQSSTGSALYRATGVSPLNSGTIYTGTWHSYFLNATITAGTGVWQVAVSFSLDAANTQVVYSTTSIVGNGARRIGWQSIEAPYMTIVATLLVATAGDQLSLNVVPSLLDSPQASRIVTSTYVQTYETVLTKLTSFPFDAAYSMPGPAVLTVRSNQIFMIYDLKAMNNAGAFVNVMRYQVMTANEARQYLLTLPDAPIRIQAANFEPHADATFDITLSPA